ncbi:hypothetical protein HZU77_006990 [Neisseriaceae bacterium TC5R-5]|nr:hypothetical protein [Neisseriaceae bacterium TC5R-5]
MFQPIKTAFGEYLGGFYRTIVPTTTSLRAYVQRGLATSIIWAPARMIDSAEDMLASWQRNGTETNDHATHPAPLPVMLVAMAKDHTPTGAEFTRQISDAVDVTLPTDPQNRLFGLRTLAGDLRAQVAIFAHDEPSAHSLAAQLLAYLGGTNQRRFSARYPFAGEVTNWPVQIESPAIPAMSIQTESRNLTILAIDITLKVTVPLFDHPPTDDPEQPPGYPLIEQVNQTDSSSGTNQQIR